MKEIFENADLEVIQLDAEEILVQSGSGNVVECGANNPDCPEDCALDF